MESNDYYKEKSRKTIKVLGIVFDLSVVILFISLVYWIITM